MKVFFDFETYSNTPIKLGVKHYVGGEKFRPLLLSWAINNGPVKVTDSFKKSLLPICGLCIAHNAPFDVAVYEKTFGFGLHFLFDTKLSCLYLSVPASLDNACAFFGLGQKNPAGDRLIKKTLKTGGELSPKEWGEFKRYCVQDTELLRKLYKTVEPVSIDPFTLRVSELFAEINADGIRVDLKKAGTLLSAIQREKSRIEKLAIKDFGIFGEEGKPIATSADQVKKYLDTHGTPVPSIAEKDLEDFLAGRRLPAKSARLISYYRELQSRGADKLELICENELSRIYDSMIFHGTHTGRPTGGGLNLLNVKRCANGDDALLFPAALQTIQENAKTGEQVKRLSSLLWGCLLPDPGEVLVRSDLSSIEPRVGAWLRNDRRTLDLYARADAGKGKDEYTIFGESMRFPPAILRPLSKIVILAACYGMSAPRLRAQCRSFGLPDPGEEKAQKILSSYHAQNPSVKQFWFSLVRDAVATISGKPAGIFSTRKIGGKLFLAVALPSGRIKHYADVRLENVGVRGWRTFSYIDPLRGFRETARAAGLYENLVQSVAVDVSYEKALEIQNHSKIKLIIHDELCVSAKRRAVGRIKKIMSAPVPWLPEMPVASKTVVCKTFHKGDRA